MTDLDDLRRVAYGRTSNPAEEAAAAAARAEIAERDAEQKQTRAAHEAAEYTRARSIETEGDPAESTDTLTIVDVHDEPGYARRLAATWRVWAGPAFVAFVLGVVLAVASGVLVLNGMRFGDGSSGADMTIDETAGLSDAGDLEAATVMLRTPQGPEDVVSGLDPQLDAASTRLLRETLTASAYAGMAKDGRICLVLRMVDDVSMAWSCIEPSMFALQGLTIGFGTAEDELSVHWDGSEVSETKTVSSAE